MQGLRAEQHTLPLSDENRSGAQMCKLTHLVSIVFGSQSLGRKVLACLWRGNTVKIRGPQVQFTLSVQDTDRSLHSGSLNWGWKTM